MNSPEKFATALVSLALVRNGYSTYKDVPYGGPHHADILAIRTLGATEEERFVVVVRALRDRSTMPGQLDNLRDQYCSELEHTIYFAFLIDSEALLLVDAELLDRMRFIDEEISIDVIPAEALASGVHA